MAEKRPTNFRFYTVIVAIFASLLLISNIAAVRPVQLGPLVLDGGFLLFPLAYVLGDVLSEVYGFKAARTAILLGFVVLVIAVLNFWAVIGMPYPDWSENHDAFASILGLLPQIVIASACAYLVGQLLNAYVLVAIKRRFGERRMWVRLIGSTVVGEFFDTLVFALIAGSAIGVTESFGVFMNYLLVGWLYKTLFEVVLLPVTYPVIAWVKRNEPSYQLAA